MARPPRYALIPTTGRPCLKDCIDAIRDQVDKIFLVQGGPQTEPLVWDDYPIITEPELNISKWWNLGLTVIESRLWDLHHRAMPWDVAILNDDAIVPRGWMDAVCAAMRETGSAAGCSGGTSIPYRVIHHEPGPVGLMTRMKGFAFVLAGEKGVRANETLRWYFSDDHVDWLSRQLGGMVMVPGFPVEHLYPNGQVTPEMHQIIAEDAQAFTAYWGGMRPW